MMIRTTNRVVETGQRRSFALTDMVPYGWDARTDQSGTVNVSSSTTYGLPAFARAVRVYAEQLANMQLYAWTGTAATRQRADRSRQGRLFSQRPNPKQTRFDFWETIGESLIVPRNAYIWKNVDPLTGFVVEWYALDPAQVEPIVKPGGKAGEVTWRVTVRGSWVDPVGKGAGVYDVDSSTMLHIKGCPGHGQVAPSVIEQFRESLAADIARQRHESATFGKGAQLDYVVTVPAGLGKQGMREFRDNFNQTHSGPYGERTVVLGGGADVRPVGMSNADAELVSLARVTVERAAQIIGMPIGLLGPTGTPMDGRKLEHILTEWSLLGIGPMFSRIESALLGDPNIFPGPVTPSSVYPAFQQDGFIRGDVLTEDTILHNKVQDGRLLVDEARAMDGLPPLPDGAGQVPQVVPVGGAPNPLTTPQAIAGQEDKTDA